MKRICIVGAGIAGITAMKTIRKMQPDWEITIISDEDRLPYKRTKISKHIAKGFGPDDFALLPGHWYKENGIALRIGARVTKIDIENRLSALQDGSTVVWDKLLLAPGVEAKVPEVPGSLFGGCYALRRAADVEKVIIEGRRARSAVVVGLGVLGVEVSEQLRVRGLDVVAISSDNSIMSKQLNETTQLSLLHTMREQGVSVEFGRRIDKVEISRGGGAAVLSGDKTYTGDLVVFAIGSSYQKNWSQWVATDELGAIRIDDYMATSIDNVYAAGDATILPNGATCHLWHSAEAQGRCAALNICGRKSRYLQEKFRLKCEVFDRYFFSIGKPSGTPMQPLKIQESKGDIYQCFYFDNNVLSGVVMADDKSRAKVYEQAVRESWDNARVSAVFSS